MSPNVVANWQICGQGPAEQEIMKFVKEGEIKKITGLKLAQIIDLKNKTKFSGEIPNIEAIFQPKKMYNVFYNYHPSSGYSTDIIDDAGEFKIRVNRPTGGVLCGFFSEVIIFEDSKILAFPTALKN